MNRIQLQVTEFHKKFGVPMGERPAMPSEERCVLRTRLMYEELGELEQAFPRFYTSYQGNLEKLADALGDLLYVVFGTAVECGIDMEPIVDEIHKSNMTKDGGGLRADGKVLKGPEYVAPDIAAVLKEQMP
jgi:predicted HAD superfamily Cof-like phosphohydrolase